MNGRGALLSGIRDPLLEFFINECSAKEKVIIDLEREIRVQNSEIRCLYDWFRDAQDRFERYTRLIRESRARTAALERRLALMSGESPPPSPVRSIIDLVTDESDVEETPLSLV